MAVASLDPFWVLLQFGSKQVLCSRSTGEAIVVNGHKSVVDGGPFTLQKFEGEYVLIARDGDDDDKSIHFVEGFAHIRLEFAPRDGYDSPQERVVYLQGDTVPMWADAARQRYEPVAFILPAGEHGNFKAEWYWSDLGINCGAQPWRLWLSLPWLTDYLYGAGAKQTYRQIDVWRTNCKKVGLDDGHIKDSCNSKKRKAAVAMDRPQEEASAMFGIEAAPEYACTVPAFLAILIKSATTEPRANDSDASRTRDIRASQRAKAVLLTALSCCASDCDIEVDVGGTPVTLASHLQVSLDEDKLNSLRLNPRTVSHAYRLLAGNHRFVVVSFDSACEIMYCNRFSCIQCVLSGRLHVSKDLHQHREGRRRNATRPVPSRLGFQRHDSWHYKTINNEGSTHLACFGAQPDWRPLGND